MVCVRKQWATTPVAGLTFVGLVKILEIHESCHATEKVYRKDQGCLYVMRLMPSWMQ